MADETEVISGVTVRFNERGFAIYEEFTDSYGSEVRVQESSSAMGPHCWIFCANENFGYPDPKGKDRSKVWTPHLTLEQARRVRDALNAFIVHAGTRWEAPEEEEAQP